MSSSSLSAGFFVSVIQLLCRLRAACFRLGVAMSDRIEQLQDAADAVENWLDKQIVAWPRLSCVACGIAGVLVGIVLPL